MLATAWELERLMGVFHAVTLTSHAIVSAMQIGNRFRCYPTPAQEQILLRWIGCQRHIYNAKVHEERYFRSFARKSLMHTGQQAPIDQQYSQFKTELTALEPVAIRRHLRLGRLR